MSTGVITEEDIDMFHQLPERWHHDRIYNFASLRTSNVDKKLEENESPIQLCNYTDVYNNNRITAQIDFMQGTASEVEIERFSLHPGDVVITKDSESPDDIGVPALIDDEIDKLVCGYHLTILSPNESIIHSRYLFYALRSRFSAYQFYLAANGVTRFGLTYQGTKNLRIAFPPLAEQKQITDFLDYKTAQIDALIAKKKELIGRLIEKRNAVITMAVTKGLCPDVPLRDSGVEWLGQVPDHWNVKRLKFFAETVCTGSTPPSLDNRYYDDASINWFTPSDFRDGGSVMIESNRKLNVQAVKDGAVKFFDRASVLIVSIGATLGRVGITDVCFACNQQINVIIPVETMNPKFLFYSLAAQKETMKVISNATTLGIMNQEKTKQIGIAAPPCDEQARIVESLDNETRRIDDLVSQIQNAIDRLEEYRSALITAATTGKIDVRFKVKKPSGYAKSIPNAL
jgi:type I restriction enzyme S subunit